MLPSLLWELPVTEPYLGKNVASGSPSSPYKKIKNKPTDAEEEDDKSTTQYQIFI